MIGQLRAPAYTAILVASVKLRRRAPEIRHRRCLFMNLRRIAVLLIAACTVGAGAIVLTAQTAPAGAQSTTDRTPPLPAAGKPRDIRDVDGVPFLNAEGRAAYKKWMYSRYSRAFAINPKDGSWGLFPDENDMFTMSTPAGEMLRNQPLRYSIEDALNRCQKRPGDKCFIYAQNGDVVWDGKIPQSTSVAQSPPIPAAIDEERRQKELQAKAEVDRRQKEMQTRTDDERGTPAGATTAPGSTRQALVIGNDSYQNISGLNNARADAKSMAGSLGAMGYSVRAYFDLDERNMKKAIRDFTRVIAGGDEILFYFAGHGVQIGSANYLLPVDIRAEDSASVRDEAIALQRVLDDFNEVKARLALVIIDACRDNPFKGSGRAIGGRGLAPTSAATGQMIMFSAGAGQQALDKLGPSDDSPNGLFTRIFLKHVQQKGITVDKIMRDIRTEVVALAKSVGHDQVPALYDQVVGDFYFSR